MATMAASHPEEVAIDDSVQPIPSSEKMVIDLDINGISKEDNVSHNATTEPTLSKNEDSTVENVASKLLMINGNSDAHQADRVALPTPIDNSPKSQSTEPSPYSAPHSYEIMDLNTSMENESSSTSPETQLPDSSNLSVPINAVVEPSNKDSFVSQDVPLDDTKAEELQAVKLQETHDEAMSEPTNENFSSCELLNGKRESSEVMEPDAGTNVELSNFFDESSGAVAEASVLEPKQSSDLDINSPTSSGHGNHSSQHSKYEDLDTTMTGVSESSVKTSRGRECDDEIEPSAKRLRKNDNQNSSKHGASRSNVGTSDRESPPSAVKEEKNQSNMTITTYQVKEIIKILRNISRTNAGKNFRQPVAVLWPSIAENYAAKISNPMDLSTIERKLKDDSYSTINDLKADVHLIYNNSVTFNSAENPVSKCAMETRNSLLNKLSSIPPEPTPPPKKEKKVVKKPTPLASDLAIRAPAPKRPTRESQVTAQPSAQTPTQAYALDPTTNTPLIRRDSTKADGGRPKREIHPPKNKDLPYAVRPKNKKHVLELKFCDEVLTELQKPRYNSISHPFMVPVDPVALGIPNYFAVIKKPMDISTVAKKLKDGVYVNANEFEKDVRQIFINCYKYNPDGNIVRQMGKSFEEIFTNLWAKKDQFLTDNTPSAATPSDRESEDESEDEETLDGSVVTASLMSQKERLLEEQSKLITMMGAKHKDEGLLQMQTDLVELIQKRVKAAEEQARKSVNKKKTSKPVKKTAPSKKAPPPKKSNTKKKYLGTIEKETISAGLGLIPAQVMATVVEMIKTERPELEDAGDETMELDIDSISDTILWQIHALIMKHVPDLEGQIRDSMSSEPRQNPRTAKPAPKKKNKPMSKHEQERKIEALTNLDSEFARATVNSQEITTPELSNHASSPHLDTNAVLDPESSGDEDSDSEEE